MLIEHRPGHLNKRVVLAFHNAILWGSIWRRQLVVQTMVTAEVVHTRVPELSSIIGTNSPHSAITLVVQPQYQIMNKTKHLLLRLKKEHPREPREIIHYHKHIPLPTDRPNPSRTNSVHMQQLIRIRSHHLINRCMGSSNHLSMTAWMTNQILLQLELGQSSD